MDYAIVIATRNRPAALRLSIPRMLNQSRPSAQLIVIDSSDDHSATVAAVRESVGSNSVDLVVRHSEPSSSGQRNLGTTFVRCPVVMFPDDDSIWYPEAAAEILAVYERDASFQIAAVCGAESATPPSDWELTRSGGYRVRRIHRLQQRFAQLRAKVEDRCFPDPARMFGREFYPPPSALPDWFAELDVVPVEWMTGFRMSFRTEVIRRVGFDEAFSRYSLFEDIDASFGAWRHGWVVGAHQAKIYHHRSPENRDQGRRLGATQLLNKAYLIAKHSAGGHPARDLMVRFGRYKTALYSLGVRGHFGKQRFAGARAALKEIAEIAHSSPEMVEVAYRAGLDRSLGRSGG